MFLWNSKWRSSQALSFSPPCLPPCESLIFNIILQICFRNLKRKSGDTGWNRTEKKSVRHRWLEFDWRLICFGWYSRRFLPSSLALILIFPQFRFRLIRFRWRIFQSVGLVPFYFRLWEKRTRNLLLISMEILRLGFFLDCSLRSRALLHRKI